jgi:hypothetical protein
VGANGTVPTPTKRKDHVPVLCTMNVLLRVVGDPDYFVVLKLKASQPQTLWSYRPLIRLFGGASKIEMSAFKVVSLRCPCVRAAH